MNDQVEEVKQKVDIVSLINEYLQLKKAGRNFKTLCPFHNEKTPSFMVSPELQIYKCFGCGETGDIYSFLQKFEGMEFSEALRFLAERVGVKLRSIRPGEQSEKERLYELNTHTGKFYQYFLWNHPIGKKALNYLLKERGLKPDTVKSFQIGFSPDVRGVLKRYLVDKKRYYPKEVERSGTVFLKGTDLIDRFRGRIIFPLFNHRGTISGFSGRILPDEKNKDLAKYINSPETPIYHKSNILFGLNFVKEDIKKEREVVVVEGELDMISSWQAGIKNVIAIKGSALTEEQVRLISRFAKKIVLALDSDIAGDIAARKGIVIAQREGLEVRVARLGEKYKDPDEVARQDPEYYKKVLEDAIGVWDYFIESVFSRFDFQTGEGKAKISAEIVPILASIPDSIVQAHYIEVTANELGVPVEAVYEEVRNVKLQERENEVKVEVPLKKPEKLRKQLLEERLLSLAFQSDPKILLGERINFLISTPLTKRLLDEYQIYSEKHEKFSSSAFTENLPKELLTGYAEMALKDLEGLTENQDSLQKELSLVIKELEVLDIRHKLEYLGAKMRGFEESKDFDKLKKLQERFSELTLKLSRYEEEGGKGIILQEI